MTWIDCSQRLPPVGKRVLVTIKKTGLVDIGTRVGGSKRRDWNINDGMYERAKVSAWMELPEGYK